MKGMAGLRLLEPFSCSVQVEMIYQWSFQEPKLKVPTIYKAYVREYPHKIWPYSIWYSTSILGS